MEICPNCKSEMTITEVTPILFAEGLEYVTYKCKDCRSETKRTFKRRLGAWQIFDGCSGDEDHIRSQRDQLLGGLTIAFARTRGPTMIDP